MIREGRRVVNHAAVLVALLAGCSAPQPSGELEPAPGLEARLILLDPSPKLGGTLRVRLELTNKASIAYRYDSQSVGVNDSLVVRGPAGPAAYVYGSYQTFGWPKDLEPGQTVALFESLDVAQQYLIVCEGRYSIQYGGAGLIVAPKEKRAGDEGPWLPVLSNTLEVVVAPGQTSDLDALSARLLPVLPRPWELTCAAYGTPERRVFLTRMASLKRDLLRAELRLEAGPVASAESVGEFRGKKVWLLSPPSVVDEIKPALVKALR